MLFYYAILFLLPAATLSGLVIVVKWRQVKWGLLDLLAIVLPGLLWMFLVSWKSAGRSLSNFIELPLLAVIIFVGALIRASFWEARSRRPSLLFLLFAIAVTTLLYLLFPGLPE